MASPKPKMSLVTSEASLRVYCFDRLVRRTFHFCKICKFIPCVKLISAYCFNDFWKKKHFTDISFERHLDHKVFCWILDSIISLFWHLDGEYVMVPKRSKRVFICFPSALLFHEQCKQQKSHDFLTLMCPSPDK